MSNLYRQPPSLDREGSPVHFSENIPLQYDMPSLTRYSLNNQPSFITVRESIPFARDTSVSLLSLSMKLRRAQQVYGNANQANGATMDSISREEIGDEAAMIVALAKLKHFQRISPLRDFYSPETCHAQLPSIAKDALRTATTSAVERALKIDRPIPKVVITKKPAHPAQNTDDEIVGFSINPFKVEKPSTEALDLLASLKKSQIPEEQANLPKPTGLPLWPVLSATKESGPRVDFSYLYPHVPEEAQTDAVSSGTQGTSEKDTVEGDTSGSCVPTAENSEKSESSARTAAGCAVPDSLSEEQVAAINQLAYDSISRVYMQRTARKALDMTRYALYETRKRSLASMTPIRAKRPKEADVITTTPTTGAAVSLLRPGNSSSLLLQQLAKKVAPRRGRPPGSTKTPIPIMASSPASAAVSAAAAAAVLSATAAASPSTSTLKVVKKSKAVPPNVVVNGAGEIKTQNQIKSHRPYGKARESWVPRRYKCTQCTYQTDNRSHLRRHESSVHSGAKMYQCYVCKLEFARSEKCRMHLSKVHPEFEYDPRLIRKDRPISVASTAAAVAAHRSTPAKKEAAATAATTSATNTATTEDAPTAPGCAAADDASKSTTGKSVLI